MGSILIQREQYTAYVWCKSTPHQAVGSQPDRQALRYSLPKLKNVDAWHATPVTMSASETAHGEAATIGGVAADCKSVPTR